MAPPSLPFTRQIRRSADVTISFCPLSDPQRREVVIRQGYIFLLTDLFLVCQRMSREELAQHGGEYEGEGSDMWLLYPPLAGKHLRVSEGRRYGELEVTIMRKEVLSIAFQDPSSAPDWKTSFEDAVTFAATRQ